VALSVSPALTLPIALNGFRVGLPVLAGIIGISPAPFLLAVQADLVVLGIGVELAAVIFAAALPLTIGSATNSLLEMITGRLENLLAVAATAITHQATPNRNASRPL